MPRASFVVFQSTNELQTVVIFALADRLAFVLPRTHHALMSWALGCIRTWLQRTRGLISHVDGTVTCRQFAQELLDALFQCQVAC